MVNNQPEIIDVKSKNDKKIMLFMLFVCIASAIELVFQFFKFDIIRLLHAALGVAAFAMFYFRKPFILFTWIWLIVQLVFIRVRVTDWETRTTYIKSIWDLTIGKYFDIYLKVSLTLNSVTLSFDVISFLLIILFNRLLKKKQELA